MVQVTYLPDIVCWIWHIAQRLLPGFTGPVPSTSLDKCYIVISYYSLKIACCKGIILHTSITLAYPTLSSAARKSKSFP